MKYEEVLWRLHIDTGKDWIWIRHIIDEVKHDNAINKKKEQYKQHMRIVRHFARMPEKIDKTYHRKPEDKKEKLYYKYIDLGD